MFSWACCILFIVVLRVGDFAAIDVVNNAASVTRLNLSLRPHATISKQRSRRQRAAKRAALSAASESESESEWEATAEPDLPCALDSARLVYFCESTKCNTITSFPNHHHQQWAAEAADRGCGQRRRQQRQQNAARARKNRWRRC